MEVAFIFVRSGNWVGREGFQIPRFQAGWLEVLTLPPFALSRPPSLYRARSVFAPVLHEFKFNSHGARDFYKYQPLWPRFCSLKEWFNCSVKPRWSCRGFASLVGIVWDFAGLRCIEFVFDFPSVFVLCCLDVGVFAVKKRVTVTFYV